MRPSSKELLAPASPGSPLLSPSSPDSSPAIKRRSSFPLTGRKGRVDGCIGAGIGVDIGLNDSIDSGGAGFENVAPTTLFDASNGFPASSCGFSASQRRLLGLDPKLFRGILADQLGAYRKIDRIWAKFLKRNVHDDDGKIRGLGGTDGGSGGGSGGSGDGGGGSGIETGECGSGSDNENEIQNYEELKRVAVS